VTLDQSGHANRHDAARWPSMIDNVAQHMLVYARITPDTVGWLHAHARYLNYGTSLQLRRLTDYGSALRR
jgi:hypothetical protein